MYHGKCLEGSDPSGSRATLLHRHMTLSLKAALSSHFLLDVDSPFATGGQSNQ